MTIEKKTSVGAGELALNDERFNVVFGSPAGKPTVAFHGTISTPNPTTVLNPFIDSVHLTTTARGHQAIDIDLRGLEFLNSSGFKAFIYWIRCIEGLPADQRYQLRFLSNPARRWQKTSLLALSCFSSTIVSIVA